MANNRQTWVSILIASAIIVGVLALTIAGSTALFFYRHISTEVTSNETAAAEFSRARERFAGQQPLIEFENDEPVLHRRARPPAAHRIEKLHVLAYDNEGKLVRIDVPFWLLRLAPSKNIRFLDDQVDFGSDAPQLTIDDVERHGPGLIFEQRSRGGDQVLVWAE